MQPWYMKRKRGGNNKCDILWGFPPGLWIIALRHMDKSCMYVMCIKETVVKKTIGESSQRIRIFTSALNQKLSIVQHSKALPLFAFQLYWKMRCQEKISFFD